MLEPRPFFSYDPNRLFDTVAAWFGVSDDKMLSRLLHLSPPVIRGMRARRLPVQPSILAAIAGSSARAWTNCAYCSATGASDAGQQEQSGMTALERHLK